MGSILLFLKENCPTRAFPCYLIPLLSKASICPCWLEEAFWTYRKALGFPGGSGAQRLATLTSAHCRSPGTSLAFKPPCFIGGVCETSETMPSSYMGERRNCALPSPASPTVCPTDSNLLSCGNSFLTVQPPNLQKPTNKGNSIIRNLNAEAAVANRNRCSISIEAVSSVTDANTGPHPAWCWLLNQSRTT